MAQSRKTAVARKVTKPARPASGAKKAGARPAKAAAKPARKPSAPVKATKPAPAKAAKPAPPAKGAKPVAAKTPPTKAAAPAKGAAPVKSGARPPLKAVPANKSGKGAVQPAAKKGAAPPPAPSSKKAAAKGRIVLVQRAAKPDPQVRPLGVLPPESRARVPERAAAPANVHRTTPLRPKPAAARSQGADRVSEQDLKEFETRLLAERERLLREMGHLESTIKVNQRDSSGDLSGYSFHMADAGTDAIEREKAFMFASAEGRMLLEIKDALGRLYRGEYGVCESCQKPIARARLQAMPYARLCVSCKEKEEKASRGAM